MRRSLPVALLASLALTAPAAAIQFVSGERDVFAVQRASGVAFTNSEIQFSIGAPDGDRVVAASVTLPDGVTVFPLTSDGTNARGYAFPPSPGAMTAAFPSGNYTYRDTLASGATQSFVITDDLSIHPSNFPQIIGFSALARLNVAATTVITTTRFTDPAGYARSGYFTLYHNGSTQVFNDSNLADLAAGQFVIPAGTLVAGETYGYQLGWFTQTYFTRDGNTLITAQTLRYADGGTFTIDPAASAPEPATWAMMAAGFGAVGAIMRRRAARVTARP